MRSARELAVVPQILAEVRRRHPALTEMSLDAVAAGRGHVQPFGLLGHRGFFTGASTSARRFSRARAASTCGCNSPSAFFHNSMNCR
jgi:hypothetical protein